MTNLYIGDYNLYKKEFIKDLEESGIFVNKPGHYIFENKPLDVASTEEFVNWYNSNTGIQDGITVAILAPSFIKDATQQQLLKIFEEPRAGYKIYFFAPSGSNILETIRSRCFVYEIGNGDGYNTTGIAGDFLRKSPALRLAFIEKEIKKLESFEIRTYAEQLVRELCTKYSPVINNDKKLSSSEIKIRKASAEACLSASLALSAQRIPPRYILEHLALVL